MYRRLGRDRQRYWKQRERLRRQKGWEGDDLSPELLALLDAPDGFRAREENLDRHRAHRDAMKRDAEAAGLASVAAVLTQQRTSAETRDAKSAAAVSRRNATQLRKRAAVAAELLQQTQGLLGEAARDLQKVSPPFSRLNPTSAHMHAHMHACMFMMLT